RKHLLAAIERIARAEAAAAGAPKEPTVAVVESCHATINDPQLNARVTASLRRVLGAANVVDTAPEMGSEDFSEFGAAGIPAVIFSLGAAEPAKFAQAKAAGTQLPSLHSQLFAPDRDATITTGIKAETAVLLDLLGKP
ncbi:MAG: amidohydrolase, partial [Acidobacteriota bacterium]|nr:amidohydrolase [Acidobacteriota bacterium]